MRYIISQCWKSGVVTSSQNTPVCSQSWRWVLTEVKQPIEVSAAMFLHGVELLFNPKPWSPICNSEKRWPLCCLIVAVFGSCRLFFVGWSEHPHALPICFSGLMQDQAQWEMLGLPRERECCSAFYKWLGLDRADEELITLYHSLCAFWNRPWNETVEPRCSLGTIYPTVISIWTLAKVTVSHLTVHPTRWLTKFSACLKVTVMSQTGSGTRDSN